MLRERQVQRGRLVQRERPGLLELRASLEPRVSQVLSARLASRGRLVRRVRRVPLDYRELREARGRLVQLDQWGRRVRLGCKAYPERPGLREWQDPRAQRVRRGLCIKGLIAR